MRRRIATILLTFVLAATPLVAATPTWEDVDTPSMQIASQEGTEATADVEIAVRNGYVYLYCAKPVQVKVFSILGQLIAQSNLSAGTHRLKLTTRGIYILRAGALTQRITI